MSQDKMESKNPEQKVKDKAGIGQSDQEKGIASKEEQERKQKELEQNENIKRRPQFNGSPDDDSSSEQPLQFEE
jgi:hypothetical protein